MNIIRIRNNNLNDNTLLYKKEQRKTKSKVNPRRQAGAPVLGWVCLSALFLWSKSRRFADAENC